MGENIGSLIENVPTCNLLDHGNKVFRIFEQDQSVEGVVVLDQEKPVGLLMRNMFYQMIGRLYGREVYLGRTVELMMNRDILVVDSSVDIADVGLMAVSRSQEFRYDFVLATDNSRYAGAVSISLFLMELYNRREREIELLKKQQRILTEANEAETRHRIVIEQKNIELHTQKETIQTLLDNAGQGFLSFGRDLLVLEGTSKECKTIFKREISGINITDLLGQYIADDTLSHIKSVLEKVFEFDNRLKQKVYLSLLPDEIVIEGKTINVEYKAVTKNLTVTIMLILTDVTDKKELELKMVEEQQNTRLILTAMTKHNELIAGVERYKYFFKHEIYELLTEKRKNENALKSIFRAVHTFKGDFGQLNMHHTAANLHKLENQISDIFEREKEISEELIFEFISAINYLDLIEKDMNTIRKMLGESFFYRGRTFSVAKERILEIEDRIYEEPDRGLRDSLLPMVRALRYENIKDILMHYDDYLNNLSEKMDKQIRFTVSGDDVWFDAEVYQPIIKSLVHIFRNAVDHGVETVEERIEKGKPESGTVECQVRTDRKKWFSITIKDDGRGLDYKRIKDKAVETGIYTSSEVELFDDTDIADLIFLDRFSTKNGSSFISGRGVGLNAVKQEAEQIGAALSVNSKQGEGCEFYLYLPILEEGRLHTTDITMEVLD